MADAVVAIKIVTDYAQGAAGLNNAGSRVQRFGNTVSKLTVPAALALAGIAKFAQGAVSAASRAEQAMGGVDAVFGKNADTIKAWADAAAGSIGLSKASYGELATVIGSQLKNAGFSMDEVTTKTGALIRKGADLAAMYGGTTAEAVQALSSVMKGETDPIERYGASITEAAVAGEMAAHGWDKLTGKAETQAKAQARLNLITKQTTDAEGAAAREHDSAASSAQQLSAEYENLSAELGDQLLPMLVQFAGYLSYLVGLMSRHTTTTKLVIVAVAALAAGILVLNVALKVYTLVTAIAGSTTAMAWLAALWPVLLVVAAIAAVVAIVIIAWRKSETFRTVVLAVWAAVRKAAIVAGRAIASAWSAVVNTIKARFQLIAAIAKAVWNAIKSAASSVARAVSSVWSSASSRIRSIFSTIKSVAINVWQAIRSAIDTVVDKIQALISKLRGIQVPGAIKSALEGIKSAVQNVIDAVQSLIGWLKNIPVPHINWPSPPAWLDKITPGSFSAAPAPATGRTGYAAPMVPMGRATSGGGFGVTVINVTGALDPEAVARQIQRVQRGHTRRVGLRSA